MKRNLIIFLIVVLVAVAGFIYFTQEEVSFTKETSLYKAVPTTVPLFVEFESLKSIPFANEIIRSLFSADTKIPFVDWIKDIDTLIKADRNISNSLRDESFILAFDFAGKTGIVPTVIKKAESNSKKKAIEKLINSLYPEGEFSYEKRRYSGNEITDITANDKNKSIHYCLTSGLFIASTKAIFIEKAIRQLGTPTLLNDRYFTKVNKTVTAQEEVSLFINHKQFPDLIANWINPKAVSSVDEFGETQSVNFRQLISNLEGYGAWSEMEIDFNDKEIALNGISTAEDSLTHFLSLFENQQAVRFAADQVLPKNTSFFVSFAFSDKERFFSNLENYFTHSDRHYKREQQIKKIERGFRTNLKEHFKGIIKDEVIVAATTIPSKPENRTTFFILHTEGRTSAEESIRSFLSSYAKRMGMDENTLKSTFSVDNETNFIIYKFPYPSFPKVWLGNPFAFAQANFVAMHDNFMVFSNSEKGLKDYLQSMLLKATMDKDIQYLRFKQNIENKSNINVYFDISKSFNLNKEIFAKEVSKSLEVRKEAFQNLQAVNWQVTCNKDIFFNSVYLSVKQDLGGEAKTTWQSNIGSGIDFKPQIVKNHKEPGSREVILQDNQNNLQLITKEGRVRWTVPVDGAIKGEIHQVDYYKNGKWQYLFNTKSRLYLLDRNGNNVARFPVSFRSPATNGVSVFDYDNNRNYRYFVACENKKVYAYDSEGKILSGWGFGQTDHAVLNPVQHFRVANKDYIVFKDKSRIYIQNRRGASRIATPVKFENSLNQLVLNLNGTPKIVATDVSGKVYYLYFNGKYVEKKTAKFSANHFFTVNDINGNGVPDFVFIDKNELTVMDEKGTKLFSKKFDNVIKHRPNVYTFASNLKKIGVVDSEKNRIYLYDPAGKLHKGFPLHGNSEFSIGKISPNSGQLNLVVGSEGGDLYNYTLN